eukprot:7375867-Prymnesium_polylepis.1
MPGVEVVNARLGQEGWSGGRQNYADTDGRRRKLKATPASKKVACTPARASSRSSRGPPPLRTSVGSSSPR